VKTQRVGKSWTSFPEPDDTTVRSLLGLFNGTFQDRKTYLPNFLIDLCSEAKKASGLAGRGQFFKKRISPSRMRNSPEIRAYGKTMNYRDGGEIFSEEVLTRKGRKSQEGEVTSEITGIENVNSFP